VNEDGKSTSPLKLARHANGWTQASAMRRFRAAVIRQGDNCPDGESLRREFALWESGQRAVRNPTYRRAFVEIYEVAPEILGFESRTDDAVAELATGLRLFTIDREIVRLVEEQTENLRKTDRRVGTAALMAQAEGHVSQIETLLHSSVGGERPALAGALAEAAALAGWLALDDANLPLAWNLHEKAKSAAREAEDPNVLAHVTAQQACVLLDTQTHEKAVLLAEQALSPTPRTLTRPLRAWLNATQAECLAAQGKTAASTAAMDRAERLATGQAADVPSYLLLSDAHLARWRGHCLARVGDVASIEVLRAAESATADSVRAGIGLSTDLAIAMHQAGRTDEAITVARGANDRAALHGSKRQRRRLVPLLGAVQSDEMKQAD